MMSRACADCGIVAISTKNRSGRCRGCTARYLSKQPWFQEKRRAGIAGYDPDRPTNCRVCDSRINRRNRTGLCLPCFNRDPQLAAKRGAGVARYMHRRLREDAEFAARQRAQGAWLGKTGLGNAATPAGSEPRRRSGEKARERYLGWCPPAYRPLYRSLLKNKKLGMAEARRRTLLQVEADRLRSLATLDNLESALFHLRRLTAVFKRAGGYLYGTTLLTPEQLIKRAMDKGWTPTERRLAA